MGRSAEMWQEQQEMEQAHHEWEQQQAEQEEAGHEEVRDQLMCIHVISVL